MGDTPGLARVAPLLVLILAFGALGGLIAAQLPDGKDGPLYVSLVAALGALAGWAAVFAAWGPPTGLVPAVAAPRAERDAGERPGAVEIYQSTLMHIWSDGVVTLKEAKTLANLRRKLHIDDTLAQRLEDDVKEVLFGSDVGERA